LVLSRLLTLRCIWVNFENLLTLRVLQLELKSPHQILFQWTGIHVFDIRPGPHVKVCNTFFPENGDDPLIEPPRISELEVNIWPFISEISNNKPSFLYNCQDRVRNPIIPLDIFNALCAQAYLPGSSDAAACRPFSPVLDIRTAISPATTAAAKDVPLQRAMPVKRRSSPTCDSSWPW
jgi:hypothetical protein